MKNDGAAFGERLQKAAKAAGITTNAEFARAIKALPGTAYKWWSGTTQNVAAADVYRIAGALGVRAKWLVLGTGPMRALPDSDELTDEEVSIIEAYRRMSTSERQLFRGLAQRFEVTTRAGRRAGL